MIQIVVSELGTIPKGSELFSNACKKDWRNWKLDENFEEKCILKISKNTQNSPRDLWRLAFSQTPGKNHQLMLVRKIHKSSNNNIDKVSELSVYFIPNDIYKVENSRIFQKRSYKAIKDD